jgi:glucose-1-phosphate cytidylyltransferase
MIGTSVETLSVKTVILCGGKGTRAYPHTIDLPKPLLEVAERPMLRHVMDIYAAQGFTSFVLAAGYRVDMIETFASGLPGAWDVDVVDTGEDTNTGGRIARCRERMGDRFFATYGDGVGNVDLAALLAFHERHGGAGTMTTVPLPSQYGTIDIDGTAKVERFREKPVLRDHWINAGFFVLDDRAFAHWEGEDLEREVLPGLAAAGELFAYRHTGFWKSMDTYKDAVELTSLCTPTPDKPEGAAPWMNFVAAASS